MGKGKLLSGQGSYINRGAKEDYNEIFQAGAIPAALMDAEAKYLRPLSLSNKPSLVPPGLLEEIPNADSTVHIEIG
jgi:hypothetical protein